MRGSKLFINFFRKKIFAKEKKIKKQYFLKDVVPGSPSDLFLGRRTQPKEGRKGGAIWLWRQPAKLVSFGMREFERAFLLGRETLRKEKLRFSHPRRFYFSKSLIIAMMLCILCMPKLLGIENTLQKL